MELAQAVETLRGVAAIALGLVAFVAMAIVLMFGIAVWIARPALDAFDEGER